MRRCEVAGRAAPGLDVDEPSYPPVLCSGDEDVVGDNGRRRPGDRVHKRLTARRVPEAHAGKRSPRWDEKKRRD